MVKGKRMRAHFRLSDHEGRKARRTGYHQMRGDPDRMIPARANITAEDLKWIKALAYMSSMTQEAAIGALSVMAARALKKAGLMEIPQDLARFEITPIKSPPWEEPPT